MATKLLDMPTDILIAILNRMNLDDLWNVSNTSKQLQAVAGKVWAQGGKDIDTLTKRVIEVSNKLERCTQRVSTGKLNFQALVKKEPTFSQEKLASAAKQIDAAVLKTRQEMQKLNAWLGQMLTQANKLRQSAAKLDEVDKRKALISAVSDLDKEIQDMTKTCEKCTVDAMTIREDLAKLVKANGRTLKG